MALCQNSFDSLVIKIAKVCAEGMRHIYIAFPADFLQGVRRGCALGLVILSIYKGRFLHRKALGPWLAQSPVFDFGGVRRVCVEGQSYSSGKSAREHPCGHLGASRPGTTDTHMNIFWVCARGGPYIYHFSAHEL